MNPFSSFVEKYKTILSSHYFIKKTTIQVIEEEVGVSVPSSSIKVKEDVVVIQTNPFIKNELLFHQKSIVSRIKEKTGRSVTIY